MAVTERDPHTGYLTTGHEWSGIKELNTPVPRAVYFFLIVTFLFSVGYWILMPAWPVGTTYTKGLLGNDEQAIVASDVRQAAADRATWMKRIEAESFADIQRDPRLMNMVRETGRTLFGDNCAACHGRGGQGVAGLYPNLTDDDWLWGSDMAQIHQTLVQGRKGFMPAFGQVLKPEQLDDVAEYVLTLASETRPSDASERGKDIFHGQTGGCYYCHGADAKGLPSQGAANLTDKIWAVADVPAQKNLQDKKTALKNFISSGVNNTRIMPSWKDRLSPTDIKLLAVYVRQLGGGKQ